MPRITKELLSKEEDDIRRVLKEAFEKSLERLRELHPKAECPVGHHPAFGLPFPVYITEPETPTACHHATQFFDGANRRRLRVYSGNEFPAYLDDLDHYAGRYTPVEASIPPTIWSVSIGGRSRNSPSFWDPPSIPGPERLNNPWEVWPTTATEVAVAGEYGTSGEVRDQQLLGVLRREARVTLHTGNNVLSDPWRGAYTVSQDSDVTSLLDPRPDRQGIS